MESWNKRNEWRVLMLTLEPDLGLAIRLSRPLLMP